MAHRLATNEEARTPARRTLELALGIRRSPARCSPPPSCSRSPATTRRRSPRSATPKSASTRCARSASSRAATIPPGLRAQLKALEEDQKRRATRSLRDGIDRILVDLLSLYRDILMLQLGVEIEPVNLAIYSELAAAAARHDPGAHARDAGRHRRPPASASRATSRRPSPSRPC